MRGNEMIKDDPLPGLLRAVMVPSWRSMMSRARDKPRP